MEDIIREIEHIEPIKTITIDNLTKEDRKAIEDLRNDTQIIIKMADKGGSLVIMDRDYYKTKLVMENHLQSKTYKKVDDNCDQIVVDNVIKHVHTFKNCLTNHEFEYLTKFDWKSSEFYAQPKTHKCKSIINAIKEQRDSEVIVITNPIDLDSRPIVAGCIAPTQRLSELISKILKTLVSKQITYIKDDWDYLRQLPTEIPYPCNLFGCDISSLYTSIPHKLGLQAIEYWLDRYPGEIPDRFSKEFILSSIRFILNNSYFYFDGQLYKQESGTSMGSIFAPDYACLTVGFLEEEKLFKGRLQAICSESEVEVIKRYFKRFMDDGSVPLPISIQKECFLNVLNNLHPAITYTMEPAEIQTQEDGCKAQVLNFLDLTVMLREDNRIETDIYY